MIFFIGTIKCIEIFAIVEKIEMMFFLSEQPIFRCCEK